MSICKQIYVQREAFLLKPIMVSLLSLNIIFYFVRGEEVEWERTVDPIKNLS